MPKDKRWKIEISLKGSVATIFFATLSSALMIGAALYFQWVTGGSGAVKEVLSGMSIVLGYCGLVAAVFLMGVFIVEFVVKRSRDALRDKDEGVYMPYPVEHELGDPDCRHDWEIVPERDGLAEYSLCRKCWKVEP